jgi:hypothetical protein
MVTMGAFTEFKLFTSLPSELRINIWKQALPAPRIVPVRYSRAFRQYTSGSAPPSLLHVCQESREVFLKSYEKLLLSKKYESSIYIDFTHDTIFFDSLDCSPEGDLAYDLGTCIQSDRILSCAIDAQLWGVLRVFRSDALSEVRQMRNLRTIALVLPMDNNEAQAYKGDRSGSSTVLFEMDSNLVPAEIRHEHWYVQNLRWELSHRLEEWGHSIPSAELWLW